MWLPPKLSNQNAFKTIWSAARSLYNMIFKIYILVERQTYSWAWDGGGRNIIGRILEVKKTKRADSLLDDDTNNCWC